MRNSPEGSTSARRKGATKLLTLLATIDSCTVNTSSGKTEVAPDRRSCCTVWVIPKGVGSVSSRVMPSCSSRHANRSVLACT